MKKVNAKKLQSEQTTLRIQEVATRLFVTQGFTATPISQISELLGLTKGALYAHFSSKEDLLLSLILCFETDYQELLISEVLSTSGGALAKLNRLVSFSAAFAAQNKELCLLLLSISNEFQGKDSELGKKLHSICDAKIRFVMRLVEEGKSEGLFDDSLNSEALAHVIVACLDGVLLQWNRFEETLDGREFVKTFRSVLTHGVCPHSDRIGNKDKLSGHRAKLSKSGMT